MVILKSCNRANLTTPPLRTPIRRAQNAQDERLGPPWSHALTRKRFHFFQAARTTRGGAHRTHIGASQPSHSPTPPLGRPHIPSWPAPAQRDRSHPAWARHARLAAAPRQDRRAGRAGHCRPRAASPTADPWAARAPQARGSARPERAPEPCRAPAAPQARRLAPRRSTQGCDRGARRSPARCIAPRRAAAPAPPASPARCATGGLVSARRAAGCRRSSRYVVGRRVASGGAAPAVRAVVRAAAAAVTRAARRAASPASAASAAAESRQPAHLRARALLPRPPERQPMGLKRARRPSACGCRRRVTPRWPRRRLQHCSARRAAARPAALAARCAGGHRCAPCFRRAPPVARRQQLRCNTRRLRRACRRVARRAPHARRATASSGFARARARRPPAGGCGSSSFLRAKGRMAGGAGWAGRGFERGAARRRVSPPRARQRPRRGELAPRLLACLATCSQQRDSQHFVRSTRRRWRQRR